MPITIPGKIVIKISGVPASTFTPHDVLYKMAQVTKKVVQKRKVGFDSKRNRYSINKVITRVTVKL